MSAEDNRKTQIDPLQRLKDGLIEDAERSTVPELWTGSLGPHGLANSLSYIFGRVRDYRSENCASREHGEEYLKKLTKDYGFESVDELFSALSDLREELRQKLSKEDFSTYFGRSLDVK